MDARREAELADEFERDADNPDVWEYVPTPPGVQRHQHRLGAQITIRLEPDLAEALRAMAARRGVGHTTLARELLAERLRRPDARVRLEHQIADIVIDGCPQAIVVSNSYTS